MALQGSRELRARLKAIKEVFKPAGKDWADYTAEEARRRVAPYRDTGKTLASIRRRNASKTKASVYGRYPVNFIDAGAKAHDIKPKHATILRFESHGQTVFAKKVHKRQQTAHPFKKEAAEAGLKKVDILGDLITLWNRAA